MKKTQFWMASTLLLAGTLALGGCGQNAGGNEDKDGNGYADEIYLYNWSEYMTQDVLDQFEAEYGIKVVETTYESNDELLAKLIAGKGGEYDIAVPTNTYLTAFQDNNLIEPFDEGAITNIGNLDPAFRGLPYDPTNSFSIPYMGTLSLSLGNGPMLDALGVTVDTAEDLLNPALAGNILMADDVEGIVTLGLEGTDQDPTTTDLGTLDAVKEYLLQLNTNLKSYSQIADERISITRGEVALAYIYSGDALQAMTENPDLKVVMKKEAFPLTVDNFVILKGTRHKKEAQLFIDFLLRPEIYAQLMDEFRYVCFNQAAIPYLPEDLQNSEICVLTDEIKNNMFVVNEKDADMLAKIVELVTEVKSAK